MKNKIREHTGKILPYLTVFGVLGIAIYATHKTMDKAKQSKILLDFDYDPRLISIIKEFFKGKNAKR